MASGERKREEFQSETGREKSQSQSQSQSVVVNACSSSLFYTVSGESQTGKKNYYYEQLGAPSILKPSFRDLPGCTRLSSVGVGVPSTFTSTPTPLRQFPLDKLNSKSSKTMGKSPTSSSLGKREKYISPIKVNAKIRHIYSHITTTTSGSSTLSHQSQSSMTSVSTSTHTQTEQEPSPSFDDPVDSSDAIGEESAPAPSAKDACTSMSPPPLLNHVPNVNDVDFPKSAYPYPYFDPSDPQRLFTVPPSYAGKLEDLEKITGHIVIQRFFTRADEAFGVWLEKQLGMNSKSVGVGLDTVEIINPSDAKTDSMGSLGSPTPREGRILEKILEVEDAFNSDGSEAEAEETSVAMVTGKPEKELELESDLECRVDDLVKCECFLQYFIRIEKKSDDDDCETPTPNVVNVLNVESKTLELEPFERELLEQCVEFQIVKDVKNEAGAGAGAISMGSGSPEPERSLSRVSLKNPVPEPDDLSNDNETELRLSKCLVESVLKEFIEDATANATPTVKQAQAAPTGQKLETSGDGDTDKPPSRPSPSSSEIEIERPCIPDVIHVSHSHLYQNSKSPKEPQEQGQGESSSRLSESQFEFDAQHKVAEYLGKLAINDTDTKSSPSSPVPVLPSVKMEECQEQEEIEIQGESSRSRSPLLQVQTEEAQIAQFSEFPQDPDPDENLIKRSVSADSCIGTESSGETRLSTSTTSTTATANPNLNSMITGGESNLNLNDSGILLDSGRPEIEMEIVEESESSEPSQQLRPHSHVASGGGGGDGASLVEEEIEAQERKLEKVKAVSNLTNNKSLDDFSRSDMSSGLKQSDEGDADQSESDSELDSLLLRGKSAGGEGEEGPTDTDMDLSRQTRQRPRSDAEEEIEVDVNDDDDEDGEGQEDEEQDQFDTIIENHEKEKRQSQRPCRKRNVSTQTTQSVEWESSLVSSCATSRSTTATSESSFDLEFVSKSRKYISHIPSTSGTGTGPGRGIGARSRTKHSENPEHVQIPQTEGSTQGKKRSSYLPSTGLGLNVLNMKFTMGKEFESEVSIRIPPKSPSVSSTGGGGGGGAGRINSSCQSQSQSQTLPVIASSQSQRWKGQKEEQDLRNLWQDVKSKMETRVGVGVGGGCSVGGSGSGGGGGLGLGESGERELQVRGRRMSLISSSAEGGEEARDAGAVNGGGGGGGRQQTAKTEFSGCGSGSVATTIATSFEGGMNMNMSVKSPAFEDERIKRSLKRLKKILDD